MPDEIDIDALDAVTGGAVDSYMYFTTANDRAAAIVEGIQAVVDSVTDAVSGAGKGPK